MVSSVPLIDRPVIPFNRPTQVAGGAQALCAALDEGHLSGDGPYTARCHALLERELGVARALLTTSCTDALEMAGLLLDLQAGDEVVVPSFTFVSSANAFALRGAKPVFVDIRPDTLNIDETELAAGVTARTKAAVVVHYAGIGCEMDQILDVTAPRGIRVVEDNAHGLFGRYRGRPLGTFGELATLSFHATKNFTCGEGGALLLNDAAQAARAEILREKGTNRKRFLRGEVDKYTWVDLGSSFLPSELLAALLYAQLEERARIQAARRAIWEYYDASLREWAAAQGVHTPTVPPHCDPAYHLYYLVLPTAEARPRVAAGLRAAGIMTASHYVPLHLSEMGRAFGGRPGQCPVTESVSDRLLRLPFWTDLSRPELERIVSAVQEIDIA